MSSTFTSLLQALRIAPNTTNSKPPAQKMFLDTATDGILPSGLPVICLAEVAAHDDFCDCWIVVYDRVYDVTSFLRSHPGGEGVILDYAGRDATIAFHGTGHSRDAVDQLRDYCIGELPVKERIFRNENAKIKLKGIPE